MASEKILSTLSVKITGQTAELRKSMIKAQSYVGNFKKKSLRAARDFKTGFSQTIGGGLTAINPQFAALQNILGGGTRAMGGLTKGTKLFGKAMIATGIGAIVLTLTYLYDQLKNTKGGFEIVAKATNVVTAVFGKLMEGVGAIGRAIMKVFKGDFKGAADEARVAFDALSSGMVDAVKQGIKAGAEEVKLKEMQLDLTKKIANADAEMVKNRAAARDISKSGAQRLKLALEAEKQANLKADLRLKLEKQRLKVLKEKNALANSGFEDMQAESDQMAIIAGIDKQRAMDLAEIGEKKRSALKTISAQNVELEKQEALIKRIKELDNQEGPKRKDITSMSAAIPIKANSDPGKDINKDIAARKDANQKEIDANQEKLDQIAIDNEAAKQQKIQSVANTIEIIGGFVNAFATMQNAALNKELANAGSNEAKKEQIRRKYAKKQKRMAIIQALINGALGITKTIGTMGMPLAIPFIAMAALTTGAAIASMSSKAFANGGVFGGSMATVGERGTEAAFAPQGTRIISHNDAMHALRSKRQSTTTTETVIRGEDIYIAYNEYARQKEGVL